MRRPLHGSLRGLLVALLAAGCAHGPPHPDAAAGPGPVPPDPDAARAVLERPRFREGVDDPAAFPFGYGEHAERYARLALDELLRESGTPGLAAAVFHDDDIVFTGYWGVADLETGRPVDENTLFQAASISKPVGAAAVLRAAEEGLFTLDTPVNEILSRWQLPENVFTRRAAVTPRRLLTHTAGTTMPGFPGYSPFEPLPTPLEVLDATGTCNTAPVRVDIVPGSGFRYSGGGTTILQVALEDAVGRPYREILRDWVLTPAGMTASAYDQPMTGARAELAARAHHHPDSPVVGEVLTDTAVRMEHAVRSRVPWHAYPELQAAGLWTTPVDLSRFALEIGRAVRGEEGHILKPAMAREMTTEISPGDEGLGFNMQDRGSAEKPIWYFSHSGGNWGFRCYLIARRDRGEGAAVMVNGDDFEIILELVRRIAETWAWEGDWAHTPRNWDEAG